MSTSITPPSPGSPNGQPPGSPRIAREVACAVMAEGLYDLARTRKWFSGDASTASGVALRSGPSRYAIYPSDIRLNPLKDALVNTRCEVALTMTSSVVGAITGAMDRSTSQVKLSDTYLIPVVDSWKELPFVRGGQNIGCCFVRTANTLLVWCEQSSDLEGAATMFHQLMTAYVWSHATGATDPAESAVDLPALAYSSGAISESHLGSTASISEKEKILEFVPEERLINPQGALLSGLGVAVNIVICSLWARNLVLECLLDGTYLRLAILAAFPATFVIGLFLCDSLVGSFGQLFLPIRQMSQNSMSYSGKAPTHLTHSLPAMTIMMPVYKEGLDAVLAPSIESLAAAIRTYEAQGGTANILICEDGMTLLGAEDAKMRKEYYSKYNCGWAARPGHNVDGYIRQGRFKKASNMNSVMNLSLAVEEAMDAERPDRPTWSHFDEQDLYEKKLAELLSKEDNVMQADGNLRIGDYILIVDSDTRVPEDCLLDAASEMEQSPEVAILQHASGTFLAGAGYFENGIAFFTKSINFSISWMTSNGSCAPFVGHNAFLRWSTLQQQAVTDPDDGQIKVWSESHVSEDFVLSLNCLELGYIVRWATYSNFEFLEGVSLSCEDEINRWQKYAFGCSEMIFQPMVWWWKRGPITGLFNRYLWSDIPVHYKFGTFSYVFSYYAIACGVGLGVPVYFVQGFFYDTTDPSWLPSFSILLTTIVVFLIVGNLSLVVARYRARQASILRAFYEHSKWLPLTAILFGGMSYHVLTALLAHLFSYNMTWAGTVKDLKDSNIVKEVKVILKRFYGMLTAMVILLAAVVILSTKLVPLEWRIVDLSFILPISFTISMHIMYPILLNPHIMLFHF